MLCVLWKCACVAQRSPGAPRPKHVLAVLVLGVGTAASTLPEARLACCGDYLNCLNVPRAIAFRETGACQAWGSPCPSCPTNSSRCPSCNMTEIYGVCLDRPGLPHALLLTSYATSQVPPGSSQYTNYQQHNVSPYHGESSSSSGSIGH